MTRGRSIDLERSPLSSAVRRARRVLGGVALAAAAVLIGPWASPAAAHAILVSASPGDGARLDAAPTEVSLEFNEPVSAELGGLRVFDADGGRVDRGAVRSRDRTVAVDLVPELDEGSYVASYRVVSADGHPVDGGIVFTVGDDDADAAGLSRLLDGDEDIPWEIAGAIARWLAMAGALVVVGGVAFVCWCRPSRRPAMDVALRGATTAGALGLLATVPVQAALATGQGASSLFEDGVLRSVLGDGIGWSVVLGVVGLVVAAAAVWRTRPVAIAACGMVVASFPMVGHTRFDDVGVGVASDLVHVAAAAMWAGGLVFLLLVLRSEVDRVERARIVGRFSGLATVGIALVALSGLALAWIEVKALDALTATTYGWTLLAKVGVVVLVGGAGAYNHFRVVPAVRHSPDAHEGGHRLRSSVAGEVVGVGVAVALTALLVNMTPAYVDAGIGQLHSEILELGDAGSVQLVVDPNRAGANSIHLYFYDPDGRPAEIAEDVRVEISKPGDDIGPIERTPFRAGPAHFQWDGSELVNGGRWEITVVARIDRFEEQTATADVLVGS